MTISTSALITAPDHTRAPSPLDAPPGQFANIPFLVELRSEMPA